MTNGLIFLANVPAFMLDATRLLSERIVGGQDVPDPIPWQVSVLNNQIHFCGATILDERTLISAASCFYGNSNGTNGISIRVGSVQNIGGQGQVSIIAYLRYLERICEKQHFLT